MTARLSLNPHTPPTGTGVRAPSRRRAAPPDIGSALWWVAFVVLFLALLLIFP